MGRKAGRYRGSGIAAAAPASRCAGATAAHLRGGGAVQIAVDRIAIQTGQRRDLLGVQFQAEGHDNFAEFGLGNFRTLYVFIFHYAVWD